MEGVARERSLEKEGSELRWKLSVGRRREEPWETGQFRGGWQGAEREPMPRDHCFGWEIFVTYEIIPCG